MQNGGQWFVVGDQRKVPTVQVLMKLLDGKDYSEHLLLNLGIVSFYFR